MIQINTGLKVSLMVLFVIGIVSCAGSKEPTYNMEQSAPFEIKEVHMKPWVAGVQEGGSGMDFHIVFGPMEKTVFMERVFFRDYSETLQSRPEVHNKYTAHAQRGVKTDRNMEGDVKLEGNTPPEKNPFDLKKDEAVLMYKYRGITNYYKVSGIEEKPLLAYPSSNPNGGL